MVLNVAHTVADNFTKSTFVRATAFGLGLGTLGAASFALGPELAAMLGSLELSGTFANGFLVGVATAALAPRALGWLRSEATPRSTDAAARTA